MTHDAVWFNATLEAAQDHCGAATCNAQFSHFWDIVQNRVGNSSVYGKYSSKSFVSNWCDGWESFNNQLDSCLLRCKSDYCNVYIVLLYLHKTAIDIL